MLEPTCLSRHILQLNSLLLCSMGVKARAPLGLSSAFCHSPWTFSERPSSWVRSGVVLFCPRPQQDSAQVVPPKGSRDMVCWTVGNCCSLLYPQLCWCPWAGRGEWIRGLSHPVNTGAPSCYRGRTEGSGEVSLQGREVVLALENTRWRPSSLGFSWGPREHSKAFGLRYQEH